MGTGGLPREIAPGIHWIGNCIRQSVGELVLHAYHSVYVIAGEERSLVVDTGFPKDWRVVDAQLDELAAGGVPPVELVFPTHVEMAHAGNLGRMLAKFPDAVATGDIRDYHLFFPDFADRLAPADVGDELDLGNRTLVVFEAIFNDSVTTRWLFDPRTRALFTGDGFAYSHYHSEGECGHTAEELPELALPELTAVFSDAAFFWTRFANIEPIIERLQAMLTTHDVQLILPAHGCPITELAVTVPKAIAGLRLGREISRAEVERRLSEEIHRTRP